MYRWWWSASGEDEFGHSVVTIQIDQHQNYSWPTYKMPIDIKFSNSTHEQTVVIWDSLRTQQFTVDLDFVPTSVSFDENKWIFKTSENVASITGGHQPGSLQLRSAYPNPFNGEVTIPYSTSENFAGTLTIYDLKGREVYSTILQHAIPAEYAFHWNGQDRHGASLDSGIYLVQITSPGFGSHSQKISILK